MAWLKETFRVLRFAGAGVFAALAVSTIIDQIINSRLEVLLLSEDGGGAMLWLLAGSSLLNGLVFPVMVTALCLYGILRARGDGETVGHFVGRVGQQLYIETLRAWGSCLRWGLLFVVPGFVRLVQLVYVPFVVCLHRDYDRGEADALRTSGRYLRRSIFRTLFAILALQLAVPLILTDVLDPWRTYSATPLAALLCTALDVFVAVLTAQIFFRIFESARKELQDEPVFRMEGHQVAGQGSHV